tara:strand:- start:200 stop:838 length:639 start_codon:yes stop_codon:yes gene_type:complete
MLGTFQEEKKISKGLIKFFSNDSSFIISVAQTEQLPETKLTEVAFAGRSNVGKSSLLNAVTNRKSLAFTSKMPGRTQEINFFNLGGKLILVDLPGYGFAKASKSRITNWTSLVSSYLKYRRQLSRVFILIDSRHGLKANDHKTMKNIEEAALSFQVILTKCDKLKPDGLNKIHSLVKEKISTYTSAHPTIIATSAKNNHGINNLRFFISELI